MARVIFLSLILFAFIALQTSSVQTELIKMIAGKLTAELGTEVSIKHVDFTLFNKMNIDGIMVRDKQKDTLLYAGALKVRITDWFFLKDKAELKYIGLEDAVIKLQRKDSVWNYQFIADHFASSNSKQKKDTSAFVLNLKKINFKNISFLKNDLWRGETMHVKTGSLVVDADTIDLNKGFFKIQDIAIDKPYFAIADFAGLEPDSIHTKRVQHTVIDTGLQMNTGNLKLFVNQIAITNGTLSIESDKDKPYPEFDGSHIFITKLNGKFHHTILNKDTLKSDIDINAKERCGLELKRLKAKYKVTPEIMEFANLDLQTNKSRLGDYYAMKYKAFNHDFGNYINTVIMEGKIKNARINSDDIAYFAPQLKSWKKEVILTGDCIGTVADFNVKNLFAKAGNASYISGILTMKGLPDISKTQINFNNGIIKTNYNDAAILVPDVKQIKTPNLSVLGDVLFRGNFNGTVYDFKTSGTITSQIGAVAADVSMKFPKKKDDIYSGTVTTTQFDIGKFLDYTTLGKVDFNGKMSGSNFSLDKLKTSIEGNISKIAFNDYTYVNITTNGIFQKKYFNGEVNIDDPNLEFKSQVEVDLSKEIPSYNILGDLVKSNLKPLNFYKDNFFITGLLDVNFTGTNIDNFSGTAKFLNANISNDYDRVNFDSLSLSSGYENNKKILQLGSNDIVAKITGNFKIMELQKSFQSFLHHYYPLYIEAPKTQVADQDFTFNIKTNYFEQYLKLLDKQFSGFNDAVISGSVNTQSNILNLNAKLPFGSYKKYSITGADVFGIGTLDSLHLFGNVASIQLSDSIALPNTKYNIRSSNGKSSVSIQTSASNTLNEADINADVTTLKDGIKVNFNPSSFILNDKKWNLEKQGEIIVSKNFVSAQNVKFYQGFQEISIENENEDGDNKNNLIVKLKTVVLGDITGLVFKNPKLEGLTSGEIHLHDFYGKFNAEANLSTEQFRYNTDSVGTIHTNADYSYAEGKLHFKAESPNKDFDFTANGSFDLKDSVGLPLKTSVHLTHSRIDFLGEFLKGIFSNLDGYASGDLTINGNPQSPDLLGKIKLSNGKLKVDYTQVSYRIDSADIKFEEDGINFGEFAVYDNVNNKGIIKGKLYEKGFKNMNFDFDLSTNKLLLIDTKAIDNQQFYGKAIGKATLSFKGPEKNCKMKIVAEANDSSHIYIPSSINKESGDADFIVFKQYGKEMVTEGTGNDNFNLFVDLDVTANNKVNIDVILDPLSGDVIKATGNGRLKIKVGTKDPLSIVGRYNIEKGSYDFNFQSIIRKPFILKADAGNYIEWTGDPMNADIKIDAQYIAENVSVSDLLTNQVEVKSYSKSYRGPVYVIASLTDKLNKPNINFKIDYPQSSPLKTDPVFTELITSIEKDDNEILKQVSYLIVFDMFAPYGNNSGGGNINISSIGANTISSMVTKMMNKSISDLLFKVFHDNRLHIDVGTYFYNSTTVFNTGTTAANSANGFDRSRFNFKLAYNFFNDKVIVSFSGDIDVGFGTSSTGIPTQWLPDLNVEFVISKDKKLRGMVFSKNSLDNQYGNFGRVQRTGIGLSYKKDFEKLFGKKEEEIDAKPKQEPETKNP